MSAWASNQWAFSEEDARFEQKVADYVDAKVRPHADDHSDEQARAWVRSMGEEGLLDPCVALDVPKIALARAQMAGVSGLADSMFALQGLGYGPIALSGNEGAQERWRGPTASGEAIAAFALTEPEAGSDVAAMTTTARRVDGNWVLSGRKCFITNAGIAAYYSVFARTGAPGARGISAFVVPEASVRVVERYDMLAPHPCGEIAFDDVVLPPTAMLGAEGAGFQLAMRTLDHFRTTVGAAAIGMADRALSVARTHASERVQFGRPLLRQQQVAAQLADSFAEVAAARLLVAQAALMHRAGAEDVGVYSSAAKLLATETAQRVIDRAVQVHGGTGVRRGSVPEQLYREIRALRIYEGASEVQRVVISRSLGR